MWYINGIFLWSYKVNKNELAKIRHLLGKTQKQMAQLLGMSIRTIQSFEQGLRKVPVHTERQSLLLLSLKQFRTKERRPCWLVKKCPVKTRKDCPAWELGGGHLCWFINGTICHGQPQKSWRKKMDICKTCEVLQSLYASDVKLKS
jgi:DNA-binding XRE family transcriptional regulator